MSNQTDNRGGETEIEEVKHRSGSDLSSITLQLHLMTFSLSVTPSKEVKATTGGGCGGQGGARLRSCSDGSRYSRRGVGLPSNSSSPSLVLSNPKSGKNNN